MKSEGWPLHGKEVCSAVVGDGMPNEFDGADEGSLFRRASCRASSLTSASSTNKYKSFYEQGNGVRENRNIV